MDLRGAVFAGVTLLVFCATADGQQPAAGAGGGGQNSFQQRPNSPWRRAVGSTNQNAGEAQDPLALYQKNPELMRRYFPHLYREGAGASAGASMQENINRDMIVLPEFKFQGGTASAFVDLLKASVQPEPNIIIAPKLRDMEIPEFELKNVTLPDLFQALNNLSEDKSVQWQLSGSTEPIWILNPAPGANPQPVAGFGAGFGFPTQVMTDPITGMPLPTNNGRTCQILPLGKYLTEYKVEDITTAVKTAWSMMGDDAGAQLKYHTDTKLLIAVGTSSQLSILTQVLSSLESGMAHERKTADIPIPKASKSSQ